MGGDRDTKLLKQDLLNAGELARFLRRQMIEIGRASCRERV